MDEEMQVYSFFSVDSRIRAPYDGSLFSPLFLIIFDGEDAIAFIFRVTLPGVKIQRKVFISPSNLPPQRAQGCIREYHHSRGHTHHLQPSIPYLNVMDVKRGGIFMLVVVAF
ncbi:hypothetical protein TNCV_3858261 [Trichonephila clavipes]|nr:hypothetical protein TNCV_3858261 [Trichonephila clavipes]